MCQSRRIGLILAAAFFARVFMCPGAELTDKPQTVKTQHYLLYVPAKIDPAAKYPLVLAFSPSADGWESLHAWREVAESFKWIIYADRVTRNTYEIYKAAERVKGDYDEILKKYPVDPARVIAAGMSGGAMMAHGFASIYPDQVSAVVANSGRMNPYFKEHAQRYWKSKMVVFLASPADFRYENMVHDREFFERLKWKVKWIEFEGGHDYAPASAYRTAAGWITEQFQEASR